MKVTDFSYFYYDSYSLLRDETPDKNNDLDIDLQKIEEDVSLSRNMIQGTTWCSKVMCGTRTLHCRP